MTRCCRQDDALIRVQQLPDAQHSQRRRLADTVGAAHEDAAFALCNEIEELIEAMPESEAKYIAGERSRMLMSIDERTGHDRRLLFLLFDALN